jgi:hypothetical protein
VLESGHPKCSCPPEATRQCAANSAVVIGDAHRLIADLGPERGTGRESHVTKAAKKKVEALGSGTPSAMRSLFRSFAKLAEQAGDGRPLLRGLRVAQDPTADRIVIVHGGSRVEFVLVPCAGDPSHADVECRRMDSIGQTEAMPIASLRFNETGKVSQSSVPELVNEHISEANGAWSIVSAVIWNAMEGPG